MNHRRPRSVCLREDCVRSPPWRTAREQRPHVARSRSRPPSSRPPAGAPRRAAGQRAGADHPPRAQRHRAGRAADRADPAAAARPAAAPATPAHHPGPAETAPAEDPADRLRRRRGVLRRPRDRVRDHLPRRRRPLAGDGRAGAGPGRHLPLQRRHRDGQGRAHRRQPADPGGEPDPGRRQESRDRHRGRVLRDQLRLRHRRHPPRRVQPGHRRLGRRVDDFAAVHQKRFRRRRPDADAQVGRAREVVQDEPDLREGGHHHRLPQHHLLRPRRLRRPGRRAGLLRQGRRRARLFAVRAARRADPAAGPLGEHRRRHRAGGQRRWTGC